MFFCDKVIILPVLQSLFLWPAHLWQFLFLPLRRLKGFHLSDRVYVHHARENAHALSR